MSEDKPKIACFVCKWTNHEDELVSFKDRKAFSNVRIVNVPCLGRIDPVTVLETVLKGTDGVMLLGCAVPDCHFVKGNVYAERTVSVLKKLFDLSGLEPDRLEIRLISAAEDRKLADIISYFGQRLKKLGPSPLKVDRESKIFGGIVAAKSAVADFRLRALIGKENKLVTGSNVYGEMLSPEEFESFADGVIQAEFVRHRMLLSIREKPTSVKELAQSLGLKPNVVFRHILNMRRQGMITMDHVEGTTPVYKTLEAQ